jgi:hypothetical protein
MNKIASYDEPARTLARSAQMYQESFAHSTLVTNNTTADTGNKNNKIDFNLAGMTALFESDFFFCLHRVAIYLL